MCRNGNLLRNKITAGFSIFICWKSSFSTRGACFQYSVFTHDSNPSPKVVNDLRELYLESEPFLLTKREMNQDMLRSQIEKVILDLGSSPDDPSDAVSFAVQRVVGVQPGEHAANAVAKQIVVPIEHVSAHLQQGYTFISSLNETEVILQPNLETA
jgi:hypothetical protein